MYSLKKKSRKSIPYTKLCGKIFISCHFVIRFVLIFWVTKSKKMSLACGKLVTIRRLYSEWCFNFREFTVSQECVLKATKWTTFLYTISPWIVFFSAALYHVDIIPLKCMWLTVAINTIRTTALLSFIILFSTNIHRIILKFHSADRRRSRLFHFIILIFSNFYHLLWIINLVACQANHTKSRLYWTLYNSYTQHTLKANDERPPNNKQSKGHLKSQH